VNVPGLSAGNKSFFASFFSKKEKSSFSEEKEAKRLLFVRRFGVIGAWRHDAGATTDFGALS
jgi:hypothetical protein